MDLDGWIGGGQVSPAFLSLFDSIVIMVFIPIFVSFEQGKTRVYFVYFTRT